MADSHLHQIRNEDAEPLGLLMGSRFVCFFIQPLKRRSFCLVGGNGRENMNTLLGSSTEWDCPSHLGYGRPAAVAGISDRGDEKCREGHLALVCMQSHQLEVNHHEVTENHRGQWALGREAHIRIQSESKSDSQCRRSASISPPVPLALPTDFIMISPTSCYLSPSANTSEGRSQSGSLSATASRDCLGLDGKSSSSGYTWHWSTVLNHLRAAAAWMCGCVCWAGSQSNVFIITDALSLAGRSEGDKYKADCFGHPCAKCAQGRLLWCDRGQHPVIRYTDSALTDKVPRALPTPFLYTQHSDLDLWYDTEFSLPPLRSRREKKCSRVLDLSHAGVSWGSWYWIRNNRVKSIKTCEGWTAGQDQNLSSQVPSVEYMDCTHITSAFLLLFTFLCWFSCMNYLHLIAANRYFILA